MMTTLKQARDAGNLDQFIREREAETGDAEAVEKTIGSMAGADKGKSAKKPDEAP